MPKVNLLMVMLLVCLAVPTMAKERAKSKSSKAATKSSAKSSAAKKSTSGKTQTKISFEKSASSKSSEPEKAAAAPTNLKRERVTVEFAADEGFEEAERARAEFLRRSKERREAAKKAEADAKPKTLSVKSASNRSISIDDELGPKDKRRELGMVWKREAASDLRENSIDGEIDSLNNEKFDISPEDKTELAELMRVPTSVDEEPQKPEVKAVPSPKWTAISPRSQARASAD